LDGGTLELEGHRETILAVAWSPDGKRVATGSLDRSVRVWDLESASEIMLNGAAEEAITSLRFSPDGSLLAAGDRAFQVRLLKVSDGSVAHMQAHPDAVSSLSFSPDGQWLAVGGSSGNAAVYSVAKAGPPKCDLRGRTVSFTDGGKSLVVASQSSVLYLHDFPSCKVRKETRTGDHLPWSSASGSSALVGTRNAREGVVLLWDVRGGRMLGKLEGHKGGVTSLEIDAAGHRAATASEDRTVRLWDVDKRTELARLSADALPFVALSPDGKRALVAAGSQARVESFQK
jgi:WD40 repeat protein